MAAWATGADRCRSASNPMSFSRSLQRRSFTEKHTSENATNPSSALPAQGRAHPRYHLASPRLSPNGTGNGTLLIALTGEPGPGPIRTWATISRATFGGAIRYGSFQPMAPNCWPTANPYSSRSSTLRCSVRTHWTSVNSPLIRIMRNATAADLLRLRVYGHCGPCYPSKLARMFDPLSPAQSLLLRPPPRRDQRGAPQGVHSPCHNRTD